MPTSVEAFRFYACPADVDTGAALAAQDTAITVTDTTPFMLRTLLVCDGTADNFSKPLSYQSSKDGGAVIIVATNPAPNGGIYTVQNTADSQSLGTTVARLTGFPTPTYNSTFPSVNTNGQTNTFGSGAFGPNEKVELVMSLQLDPAYLNGSGSFEITVQYIGTHNVTPTVNYDFPTNRRIVIV